ncbi:hypothetical protein ANANG_G00227190 [Anguilla anguilla]|uniref:Beta-catenin-interacting ICAT domain-containing protein n=2 Tax=Anguilla anguilla TaxID=7936 RepID=A0A9D3M4Y6_ANGAN|nr:hypothetical protein ANANG_G00227190 [Anguilla anguilla]
MERQEGVCSAAIAFGAASKSQRYARPPPGTACARGTCASSSIKHNPPPTSNGPSARIRAHCADKSARKSRDLGPPDPGAAGMNREETPGKSPEEMYIQQKVRVLLMLKKMGSNLTQSEEAFLRNYAGVVHSQMSQLPQHPIDQGAEDVVMAFSRSETEDRRQ